MKTKFYTNDDFAEGVFTSVHPAFARANYEYCFGVKSRRRLKKGDYVKLSYINTSYLHELLNDLSENTAKVVELKNGLPSKLEAPGGRIIEVMGLIMELLPFLINLWLKIEAIFKK